MWALDFGTTNSLVARWNGALLRPEVVRLRVARGQRTGALDEAALTVPTAVSFIPGAGVLSRFARWPPWARNTLFGRWAHIGMDALRENPMWDRPSFANSFKRTLMMSPMRTVARVNGAALSAREAALSFTRELLAEVKASTGERIRDLVVTAPVEAFETYRAEWNRLAEALGLRRIRFLDEPIAAAIGYGLSITSPQRVLVVDFGGGTLHAAVVQLGSREATRGRAEVIAKAGRDVGGDRVDAWILEEMSERLSLRWDDVATDEASLWRRLMLAEARRVKEAVYFDARATFDVTPPESMRRFEQRLKGDHPPLELDTEGLRGLLERHGLYSLLDQCVEEVMAGQVIDEVLMVGGSTLLPGVYPLLEQRFGRNRVRAWQPFEAVVQGAAAYAADQVAPSDYVVHDYALLAHDLTTQAPEYVVVVRRGTRFPTAPDFWRKRLIPICPLGEPETVFKLVICEMGQQSGEAGYTWDEDGRLHRRAAALDKPIVVKLNAVNPALGRLDPPHAPKDKAARLDVMLGINAERWLCATVRDLKTRRTLMEDEPVVRLL